MIQPDGMDGPARDLAAAAGGDRRARGRRHGRTAVPFQANLLLVGSFILSGIMALLIVFVLWQSREDNWRRAERASETLLHVVLGEVARNMELQRFTLRYIASEVPTAPGQPPAAAGRHFLATAANLSDHLGALFVLNARGEVVADASGRPRRGINLSGQPYFTAARDGAPGQLHLSRPVPNPFRDGDPVFALSMPVDGWDGPAGVAVAMIRLAWIEDLFAKLDIAPGDMAVVMRDDGAVLVRQSGHGLLPMTTSLSTSPNYLRMARAPSGSFIGVSATDETERFYTFEHVPGFPLIIAIGRATDAITAGWRRQTLVLGLVTAVLCLGGIGMAAATRREMIRRARVEAHLARLSVTDSLTRLPNRRGFDQVLAREWRRAARTGTMLSLLMIDADRFKQLNDRHGHAHGDRVLKALSRAIRGSIRRPADMAARIGGEEFAILLPDTGAPGAELIAERIRTRMEEMARARTDGTTVSIGIAVARPSRDITPDDLLRCADEALYRVKNTTRNAVATRILGRTDG